MTSPTYTRASTEYQSEVPLIHMSVNLPSYLTASGQVKMYPPSLAAVVRTNDPYTTFREFKIDDKKMMSLSQNMNPLSLSTNPRLRHFDVKIEVPGEKGEILTTLFVDLYIGDKTVCTQSVSINPQNTKGVVVNFRDSSLTDTPNIKAQTFIE